MKLTSPWTGILSFIIVLFMMPLGHAAMILMEKILGHNLLYLAALLLGVIGVGLLVLGIYSKKEITATFAGLFGGMLVWTGWVEFAYVYYANRYGVQPLIENGEIVTKPEYLIMPSSVGFWAIIMLFYIFSIKSNCVCEGDKPHCCLVNLVRWACEEKFQSSEIVRKVLFVF